MSWLQELYERDETPSEAIAHLDDVRHEVNSKPAPLKTQELIG